MSQKEDGLITVLDIGSSKTRVLVAELHEGALRYRGHAQCGGCGRGCAKACDQPIWDQQCKAMEPRRPTKPSSGGQRRH